MLLFWLTVPNYDYYRDILLHCFEIQGDEYTAHYLKRRECQSHIQKYWRMSLRGSNGFSLATEKRGVKVSLHCLFKNVVATAVVRSQLG